MLKVLSFNDSAYDTFKNYQNKGMEPLKKMLKNALNLLKAQRASRNLSTLALCSKYIDPTFTNMGAEIITQRYEDIKNLFAD